MTLRRTRIKFCGMQNESDIAQSLALGVDALGFILAPSARATSLEFMAAAASTIPAFVTVVAVVVDPSSAQTLEIRRRVPSVVFQFCGDESEPACTAAAAGNPYLKVQHVEAIAEGFAHAYTRAQNYGGLALFDTAKRGLAGGTGETFAWPMRPPAATRPFMVAGGLQASNVGAAISALRPYGVDVRSGIERDGKKDEQRMRDFVIAVRRADEEQAHGA